MSSAKRSNTWSPRTAETVGADVYRAHLVDELAAISLGSGVGSASAPRDLLDRAAVEEVTVHEWLHDRALTRAGVADHMVEGGLFHAVVASVRPRPLGASQLGMGGRWEW